MKIEDLKKAMAEAERFLAAARRLEASTAEYHRTTEYEWIVKAGIVPAGRESAAVRRASLDLSRALADLRRRGA